MRGCEKKNAIQKTAEMYLLIQQIMCSFRFWEYSHEIKEISSCRHGANIQIDNKETRDRQ